MGQKSSLFVNQHPVNHSGCLSPFWTKRLPFLLIVGVLFSALVQGQQLDVQTSIKYLEQEIENDLNDGLESIIGTKKVSLEITGNEISLKYIWQDNKEVLYPNYWNKEINFSELIFDANNIKEIFKKDYGHKKAVALRCLNGTKTCFRVGENAIQEYYSKEFFDQPNYVNHYQDFVHLFYLSGTSTQNKIYNALKYIISELNEEIIAQTEGADNTEFVEGNIVHIPLTPKGGVSYLSVNIGGYQTEAILDSGASDLSINEEVESELLDRGIIKKEDYLSPALYSIADGTVIECRRFIIPYVETSGARAFHVRCSVSSKNGSLLLGGAFLKNFRSFKIDNVENQLIIEL